MKVDERRTSVDRLLTGRSVQNVFEGGSWPVGLRGVYLGKVVSIHSG